MRNRSLQHRTLLLYEYGTYHLRVCTVCLSTSTFASACFPSLHSPAPPHPCRRADNESEKGEEGEIAGGRSATTRPRSSDFSSSSSLCTVALLLLRSSPPPAVASLPHAWAPAIVVPKNLSSSSPSFSRYGDGTQCSVGLAERKRERGGGIQK